MSKRIPQKVGRWPMGRVDGETKLGRAIHDDPMLGRIRACMATGRLARVGLDTHGKLFRVWLTDQQTLDVAIAIAARANEPSLPIRKRLEHLEHARGLCVGLVSFSVVALIDVAIDAVKEAERCMWREEQARDLADDGWEDENDLY